jgi:serine protease inhibitor
MKTKTQNILLFFILTLITVGCVEDKSIKTKVLVLLRIIVFFNFYHVMEISTL